MIGSIGFYAVSAIFQPKRKQNWKIFTTEYRIYNLYILNVTFSDNKIALQGRKHTKLLYDVTERSLAAGSQQVFENAYTPVRSTFRMWVLFVSMYRTTFAPGTPTGLFARFYKMKKIINTKIVASFKKISKYWYLQLNLKF